MNERIKELLCQAHLDAENPKDTNWIANRFAELIIKECIDLLNPEGDPYTSLREDYGRSLSMNMIKKHFGVE